MEKTHKYDDIIHLSRPDSGRRVRMSMVDRGAQFAPFAALVGYDAVIEETARLTDDCSELADGGKELLDRKLRILEQEPDREVTFLIFRPDDRKAGGSYLPVAGTVKKIDLYRQTVVLTDGREIAMDAIRAIDGVDDEEAYGEE